MASGHLSSLHPPHPGSPRSGYFPLGFVHGDPRLTLAQGYTFRQLPASAPAFADGIPAPSTPRHQARSGLYYHSLALVGESLAARIAASASAGRRSYPTENYGELPFSVDARGAPWTKTLDRLDLFDPATRRYLADYVRHHVIAQTTGPLRERILLWGLDNEWEGRANHAPAARAAFRRWLETAYAGDIAELNRGWGTRHADFAAATAVTQPADVEHTAAPGRFLDWWHFQSRHFTTLLADLARTAWETDPLHRGVVHKATQLTLEMPAWRERLLDQAAFAGRLREICGGFYGLDAYGHGDRQAYEINHAFQCIRSPDGSPGHGVMLCENNNHDGPGPQFAATQWRLLANGVKGMMYFTTGFAGGQADWAHFAFVDPVRGHLREKMFYAPRWADLVHRTERFWSECIPAPGLPRLALLLPRRDVLLSPPSRRNRGDLRYAYPENHRWLFFRWLREQGYWVDILPYEKLTPDFLRGYQALCLIGAEHLTAAECEVITAFVHDGGRLIADAHAGRHDEHHREIHGLDTLLGLSLAPGAEAQSAEWRLGEETVAASGHVPVRLNGAAPIERDDAAAPPVFLHHVGRGRVLYLPFQAGSLTLRSAAAALASVQSDSATAESEEYPAHPGEFVIGRWVAALLQTAGLVPACPPADGQEILRIEQPSVDARGNCVVIFATRAHSRPAETAPAATHRLPLPATGPWACALWAPAENDDLIPVVVRSAPDGRHEVDLPPIASAGALYLLKNHPPLLGISPISGHAFAADGLTARVHPGVAFSVTVTLFAAAAPIPNEGSLRLHVPEGWTISPGRHFTPPLAAGENQSFTFVVTPHPDDRRHRPDWLTPLIARWHDGERDLAVATSCVEVTAHPDRIPRLLSDNAYFPATYAHRIATGATYRYLQPADPALIADPAAAGDGNAGSALTNGFSSIGGQRHSHHRDIPGTGHFARYRSRSVDILFDLQAEREIMRVVVVAGPGEVYPAAVQILTAADDVSFTEACRVEPDGPRLEIETPPFSQRSRHVRVLIEWPQEGGTLDEIEIWGR